MKKAHVKFIYDPHNKDEGIYIFEENWFTEKTLKEYKNWYKDRPFVHGVLKDGYLFIDIPDSLMFEVASEIHFIKSIMDEFIENEDEKSIDFVIIKKGDSFFNYTKTLNKNSC